ncbi:restriction endonuclease subunit S [Staphylococcus haemolyticus]|uniref:restriction endonuclease subunit S n=1 Tax=Staphylococcus haemolyticus TaxID=1283 RepID=UPI0029040A5C|nr:restriction endonuclease subunit S [Staphylococcus haemolyticus]MDU0441583.1 restriction endonuclease subunit S [Staphylococcus haemolyticus]MDU0473701.1 restriction endonuclease subunit S [Staphylococcus haemolyticus]
MMKLSDREWKEFKLEDIFHVELSKGDNKPNHLVKGNTPLISSGDSNNGIVKFVIKGDEKSQKFSKDKLTFDMFGKIFYHPYEFYSVSHGRINILSAKVNISSFTLMFLIAVLEKSSKNIFSYNRMASSKRIKKLKFKIPITNENTPDYNFMEDYIKENYFRLKSQIKEKQKHEINDWRGLNDVEWEDYFIEFLFQIKPGKRLTKKEFTKGSKPFIGSSDHNNGVTNFVDNHNSSEDFNVLGVNYNGSVVENFYHPYKALFSDDVKRLSLKINGNKYMYLFIKNMILKQKEKYQYGYKFNSTRMKRQIIKLPTKNNQPDYYFMEQYMKRKENEVLERI